MHQPSPMPAGSDLERLLATEARLHDRLTAARAEAARIVADAERRATALLDAMDAECRGAERALTAHIAADRDRAIAEATTATHRYVTAIRATPAATIDALADDIVQRVMGGPA